MSAISTVPVPVTAVVETEGITVGCVEGVIGRNLKVKVTDLVLVIHSTTTHGHSQARRLLPLRLVDKGGPVLEVLAVIHPRDSFKQGLGEFDTTLFGRAIVGT